MGAAQVRRIRRLAVAVALMSLTPGSALHSQQPSGTQQPAESPAPPMAQHQQKQTPGIPGWPAPLVHSFWDRANDWWFAGVGASRALDYASTLNLRRRGINEAFLTNSIVDNRPLFAGIEVGATAASVGVSYLFHRTGHHRLERWTSIVHVGVATGGAIRNYALKTPHPK
jgi:hypothetical protein